MAVGALLLVCVGGEVFCQQPLDALPSRPHHRGGRAAFCEPLFSLIEPLTGCNRSRVKEWLKGAVLVFGGALVVGAVVLAGVAAKDPSVERYSFIGLRLDGVAGNATASVDGSLITDGCRRAVVATDVAVAAMITLERGVVSVALLAHDQFAEVDKRAILRRDEERIAPNPSKPCRYAQRLLGERRRVYKAPCAERGVVRRQPFLQRAELLLDGGVVVGVAAIRGDLGSMPLGVTSADGILVVDSTNDDRSSPFDQKSGIETLLDVALEITQRCLLVVGNPTPKTLLVRSEMGGRNDPAEVKSNLCGKRFY